jgi:DNA-binding winged helix-turn-helix (wHTH) protein
MSKGPVSVRYAFGDCILDSDTRQVYRAGQPVHLGPKAWDLLQVLLAARPRVLSKLQLLGEVWPETAVSESSLSTIVAELRDALGDTAREARYLRTVYGFGYAFAARVTPLPAVSDPPPLPAGCCRLIWDEEAIEVREGAHLIGRAPDALVTIDDPLVSRQHARIALAGGVLTLEDLDSRNGTTRNGQRVSAVALLINGDVIGVGPVQLRVSLGAEYGASTLSASASRLDAAAHDPAAVDDNRLSRHVAARR